MIKRLVVLQDEQLVVREIKTNLQKASATAAAQAVAAQAALQAAAAQLVAPQAVLVGAAVGSGAAAPLPYPLGIPSLPTPATFMPDAAPGSTDAPPAPTEEGSSLAAVAKAAAMKAERAAIEHTLRQVHWNRRKAAQILGVSYKTLLNKIKESGISRA